ncbi:RmlC-like cupin domain-containing protein [Suillus subaureus]|uniref:RmlC-like cupin domain-containing protein n=1 Tax=Suillus subaureus TaxID=48587 RepID=A0A9P7EQH5_9AGAM|nr:RmlC-like cupin domain-containing protein [Suillus subaureus]KAG1827375.1 RmlC-like cupin domain-containing protein [Suillus subaureus]
MTSRNVVKKVLSIDTPEGAGARVRRSIGSASLRNLTPFLLLDHFHITEGAGFPDHPHRGQATVTYMLEGSSRHEIPQDILGPSRPAVSNGCVPSVNSTYFVFIVNLNCPVIQGKGIIHAEMPVHGKNVPEPRGLQLWVDLPKNVKMTEPSYQELDPENPIAYPEGKDGNISIKVISGKSHGVESPVRPLGGCWYFHVMMKNGATMFQDIPAGWTAFVYILKGAVSVGESGPVHDAFHTLVLSNADGETGVRLTAATEDTSFVLIAGEPLDQTVFQYGPFVMTNQEEIQRTLMDYRTGRNGFEKAHTWKSKIGNM